MPKINDGGPAFPLSEAHSFDGHGGMTLRDYFAARAMKELIGHPDAPRSLRCDIAADAYAWADAMLAAREGH